MVTALDAIGLDTKHLATAVVSATTQVGLTRKSASATAERLHKDGETNSILY